MPTNILMPALSPTMEKGNLAKWLKKEGDTVKPGDIIAEIETDKATMEVEAVDEGTLAKIVVAEGTADVPVNQVIAVLANEGEDVKAAAASRPVIPPQQAKPAQAAAAPAAAPAPAAPQAGCCPSSRGYVPRRPPRTAAATARSPRRSLAVSPRKPASTCRASPARARTAASSRATSTRRSPARDCAPPPVSLPAEPRRPSRRRCPTSRCAHCSKRAATRWCRTTACAAPSRNA